MCKGGSPIPLPVHLLLNEKPQILRSVLTCFSCLLLPVGHSAGPSLREAGLPLPGLPAFLLPLCSSKPSHPSRTSLHTTSWRKPLNLPVGIDHVTSWISNQIAFTSVPYLTSFAFVSSDAAPGELGYHSSPRYAQHCWNVIRSFLRKPSVASHCSPHQVWTCDLASLSHLTCKPGTRRGHNKCSSSQSSWVNRDELAQLSADGIRQAGLAFHFPCRSGEVRMDPQRSLSSLSF